MQAESTVSRDKKAAVPKFVRPLKFIVTIAVLWLIATRVQWSAFTRVVAHIEWHWYFVSFAIMLIQNIFSAEALRSTASAARVQRKLRDVIRLTFWSFYFSFLGSWAGGVIRWKGISGHDDRRGEALMVLLLDNFLMLSAYFVIFLVTFFPDGWRLWYLWERKIFLLYTLGVGLGIGSGLACIFSPAFTSTLERALSALMQKIPWLRFAGKKAHDLLRVLKNIQENRWVLIKVFGICVLHGGLMVVSFWAMSRAAGYSLSFYSMAWIASLSKLAQAIPVTLFGLGIVETILIVVFGRLGVEPEKGLATGLLFSSCSVGGALIGGAWYLLHQLKPFRTAK